MDSVRMNGDGSGCREKLDKDDSSKNQSGPQQGAASEMLMQNKEGGQPGEDGFEGEKNGGVGGWEMLLGPALDGEGCGCGQEAGDG